MINQKLYLYWILALALLLPSTAIAWQAFDYDQHSAAVVYDENKINLLVLTFNYGSCDTPTLNIIDTATNPNDVPSNTDLNLTWRIDWNDPWEWTATFAKMDFNDKKYVSIATLINSLLLRELVSGDFLRVKSEGFPVIKWSLRGSAKEITKAYSFCARGVNEDEQFFDSPQNGQSEDEKFF